MEIVAKTNALAEMDLLELSIFTSVDVAGQGGSSWWIIPVGGFRPRIQLCCCWCMLHDNEKIIDMCLGPINAQYYSIRWWQVWDVRQMTPTRSSTDVPYTIRSRRTLTTDESTRNRFQTCP